MFRCKLFGTTINLRSEHCIKDNSGEVYRVSEPYTNIYVRLRNDCNAKCKFCEFRGNQEKFNLDKFKFVLKEIRKTMKINKVSFTGGEPTLDIQLLSSAIEVARQIEKDSFVVVNTNGVNLHKLVGLDINSIAMSRHHYLNEKNNELLGFNAPTKTDIRAFPNKSILHLSCNLVKGYIDSEEEIINYLEFCNEVGVDDVGLVSLMKINDYCTDHHIDFNDLDFSGHSNILRNRTWNNHDCCRCANYIYASKVDANIVKMYSRYYVKANNVESQLVFDGENLKDGFNGKIII